MKKNNKNNSLKRIALFCTALFAAHCIQPTTAAVAGGATAGTVAGVALFTAVGISVHRKHGRERIERADNPIISQKELRAYQKDLRYCNRKLENLKNRSHCKRSERAQERYDRKVAKFESNRRAIKHAIGIIRSQLDNHQRKNSYDHKHNSYRFKYSDEK